MARDRSYRRLEDMAAEAERLSRHAHATPSPQAHEDARFALTAASRALRAHPSNRFRADALAQLASHHEAALPRYAEAPTQHTAPRSSRSTQNQSRSAANRDLVAARVASSVRAHMNSAGLGHQFGDVTSEAYRHAVHRETMRHVDATYTRQVDRTKARRRIMDAAFEHVHPGSAAAYMRELDRVSRNPTSSAGSAPAQPAQRAPGRPAFSKADLARATEAHIEQQSRSPDMPRRGNPYSLKEIRAKMAREMRDLARESNRASRADDRADARRHAANVRSLESALTSAQRDVDRQRRDPNGRPLEAAARASAISQQLANAQGATAQTRARHEGSGSRSASPGRLSDAVRLNEDAFRASQRAEASGRVEDHAHAASLRRTASQHPGMSPQARQLHARDAASHEAVVRHAREGREIASRDEALDRQRTARASTERAQAHVSPADDAHAQRILRDTHAAYVRDPSVDNRRAFEGAVNHVRQNFGEEAAGSMLARAVGPAAARSAPWPSTTAPARGNMPGSVPPGGAPLAREIRGLVPGRAPLSSAPEHVQQAVHDAQRLNTSYAASVDPVVAADAVRALRSASTLADQHGHTHMAADLRMEADRRAARMPAPPNYTVGRVTVQDGDGPIRTVPAIPQSDAARSSHAASAAQAGQQARANTANTEGRHARDAQTGADSKSAYHAAREQALRMSGDTEHGKRHASSGHQKAAREHLRAAEVARQTGHHEAAAHHEAIAKAHRTREHHPHLRGMLAGPAAAPAAAAGGGGGRVAAPHAAARPKGPAGQAGTGKRGGVFVQVGGRKLYGRAREAYLRRQGGG